MIPIYHKETSKARLISSGCDLIQTVCLISMSVLERNVLEDQESHISHIPTILVWGKTSSAGHMAPYSFESSEKMV